MPTIELLCPFIPCKDNLVSINNNNIVTGIDMRSVVGFMLATENLRHFTGKASHYLILGIDDIPLANDILFPDGNRMHAVHSCPSPTPDAEGEVKKIGGNYRFVKAQHPALSCRISMCYLNRGN